MKTLNFKNKSGELHANAQAYLRTLIQATPYGVHYIAQKLSSYYQGRSSSYPEMLNTELFVFSRDKEDIVNAGFAPTCKAIVWANQDHPDVQTFAQKLVKEQEIRMEEQYKKMKAIKELADAVDMEAKSIVLDSTFDACGDFRYEVSEALLMNGNDKQNACMAAYKKLLNGRVIKSDYWKVFRHLLVVLKVK